MYPSATNAIHLPWFVGLLGLLSIPQICEDLFRQLVPWAKTHRDSNPNTLLLSGAIALTKIELELQE